MVNADEQVSQHITKNVCIGYLLSNQLLPIDTHSYSVLCLKQELLRSVLLPCPDY